MLIFPTRYKKESFGLVIIEAMSYGVAVIATNEGSIPYILDKQSGIVLEQVSDLAEAFIKARETMINPETAEYCRERYLQNFTLEKFEDNLVEIMRG